MRSRDHSETIIRIFSPIPVATATIVIEHRLKLMSLSYKITTHRRAIAISFEVHSLEKDSWALQTEFFIMLSC